MDRRTLALLLLAACGGGAAATAPPEAPKKSPEEKAREAKQRALDRLYASEPKLPFVLESSRTLSASHDCAQGPFRIEGKSLGAKLGEEVQVYACTPREIKGRSRFVFDGRADDAETFGFVHAENGRCRATESELAREGDAGATLAPTKAAATAKKGHAVAATADAERLNDSADVTIPPGTDCPPQLMKVPIVMHTYETTAGNAVRAGVPFRVEIWSDEPNDLRGVVFAVKQYRIDPKTTDVDWSDLRRRREDWYARLSDFAKANDDLFVHEGTGARAEPPPAARAETPPPKPSRHAEWVPGYYHRTGSSWLWIAGWWRVPKEDVDRDLTTAAPRPPPPPKQEVARAAPPAHDVVWAEGHWQWDGARWVWVTGAWRLPPHPGVAWHPPRWVPRGAQFVLVPGAWSRPH
jgi:hypothetical protein